MRLVDKLRKISAPAPAIPAQTRTGLPGRTIEATDGVYRVHRIELPLDHRHGNATLGSIAVAPVANLANVARDPSLARVDLRRCVFFDTETTSLGGGAGTWVFLLGAGWFEKDQFVVEQFFLEDVTGERALLEAVNALFSRFDHVVSFHGKGFDVPRLGGRYLFHRMQKVLPESHLDLCIVGRSLFRGAFRDCRLQTFEKEMVGYERADDLPGAECPRAFFDHLRGASSMIPKVFEHNYLDVLTLPAIAAQFAHALENPTNPVLQSNLGVFFESVGRDSEARQIYRTAIEGLRSSRHPLLTRTLERLALLERRAGRHGISADLLRERIEVLPFSVQPMEDLAKYYEHRAHDKELAQSTVLDTKSRILTGKINLDLAARMRCLESLEHRLARLRRASGGSEGTSQNDS